MSYNITAEQKTIIGTLCGKLNITKQVKADMVAGFTNGRTETSRNMTTSEALALIQHLKKMERTTTDREDKMRKKLIAMAREIGWYIIEKGVSKANMKRINDWCITYGHGKKKLNSYDYEGLIKLVTQFETHVYHPHLRKF